jgi:putative ABC transport system ATP-binding protein
VSEEPLVQLRGIRREYRMGEQVVAAIDGVDLDIARGELLVLMGASGSGKSSLLNVIGTLDAPTAGSYLLDGREVTTLDEAARVRLRRDEVGFVFQSFHLVPRMTALRNVELPMIFAGVPRGERRARAAKALGDLGLGHRLEHRPDELSGGERQRVAIARALVLDPPLLLADEPTGNLDSASGAEVLRTLTTLNERGKTLVVVTHSDDLAKIGHRVVRMRDGRLVA